VIAPAAHPELKPYHLTKMNRVRIAFLDRDDTLIACNALEPAPFPAAPGDLIDPDKVALLSGVRDGCGALAAAGFTLVVVSNQGSVARGATDIRGVESVNRRVDELLRDSQDRPLVSRFYFCPFHPKGRIARFSREHPWRKPSGSMLLEAMRDFSAQPEDCIMIGDAPRDIEAAINAGLMPENCVQLGDSVDFSSAVQRLIRA
jgi:histidinol-phosphate phosphatase family protein